jgi:8-oxo-dGTP pyrophosphatase MutT (NUDIX family)
MKIYYMLGFLLKPFAIAGFFIYGHATHTPRVRIVVQNEKDELLLVKSWLSGDSWSLPGGGVDRNEEPFQAAQRELEEETGITLAASELKPLFSLTSFGHQEIAYGAIIVKNDVTTKVPNRFEIKEVAWFLPAELPKLGSLADKILQKIDLKS